MSLRNFVKVVKRDVLKRKDKVIKGIIVVEKDDNKIDGWSSYKFSNAVASYAGEPIGINRQHFQYDSVAKYMTRTFNAICSEAGVQCTVAMDPSDYQQLYHFKNFGDRLVRIEWNDEIRLIEPGESVTLKTRGAAYSQEIPRITPLNNGV